jgi:hypothetical protein
VPYVPTNGTSDLQEGEYMREQLELLINEYRVSIALWAHHHNYARTFPVFNYQVKLSGQATTHLIIGMSGVDLNGDNIFPNPDYKYFVISTNKYYGFVNWNFINKTHVYGQFINSNNNTIVDDFYIVNTYH